MRLSNIEADPSALEWFWIVFSTSWLSANGLFALGSRGVAPSFRSESTNGLLTDLFGGCWIGSGSTNRRLSCICATPSSISIKSATCATGRASCSLSIGLLSRLLCLWPSGFWRGRPGAWFYFFEQALQQVIIRWMHPNISIRTPAMKIRMKSTCSNVSPNMISFGLNASVHSVEAKRVSDPSVFAIHMSCSSVGTHSRISQGVFP